jgi:acetyl esterase/lipase
LRGPVVFAHGTLDRITDPGQTAAYARRLRVSGIPVAMLTVEGEKHAMLRRTEDWNTLVHRFTTAVLGSADCDALTTDPDRSDPLPVWNRRTPLASGVASIAKARFGSRLTHW